MFRCEICKNWGLDSPHRHMEEQLKGLLEPSDIKNKQSTKLFEEEELSASTIIYRYVHSENDLALIKSSQKLASRALCLCKECLKYNLSFTPHYGDGAYSTINESLKNEHPRVMHTHGIDIRSMDYRVILRINNIGKFNKIEKTAGVIRSIPLGKSLKRNDLVFTDEAAIKVIGFQKWNGNEWEDFLIEDLEGVS
jgi:hypothetical protein